MDASEIPRRQHSAVHYKDMLLFIGGELGGDSGDDQLYVSEDEEGEQDKADTVIAFNTSMYSPLSLLHYSDLYQKLLCNGPNAR